MDVDETLELVELVSAEYDVRPPEVEFKDTRVGICGRYRPCGVIVISVEPWRGVDAVLHECAHHIDNRLNGPRYTRRGRAWHDETFCKVLWDVAEAYYGSATKYAWGTEYSSVTRWYKRRVWSHVRCERT